MKKYAFRAATTLALVGLAIAGGFLAGSVYAADQRLSDADAALEKAIALIKASSNPGVEPPFGGYDDRAKMHARKARKNIAKAIAYADGTR